MIAAFMVPRESICKSCEHKIVCAFKIIEERNACMTGCSRYEKEHKPTNADRIRKMSDEELAEFMNDSNACKNFRKCNDNWTCDACWLDWLKQGYEQSEQTDDVIDRSLEEIRP